MTLEDPGNALQWVSLLCGSNGLGSLKLQWTPMWAVTQPWHAIIHAWPPSSDVLWGPSSGHIAHTNHLFLHFPDFRFWSQTEELPFLGELSTL